MASSFKPYIPQDVVSIFHCSFHPTKGNVLDWSLKVDQDLDLSSVEFSTLPSGLHLVEQDVVYFTKGEYQGVSVFRRRRTSEQGHRGFRLSSFGILLAKSARPRPWRHVQDLKALSHSCYSALDERGVLEPVDSDWEPAEAFFERRRARATTLIGGGEWKGWSDELDGPSPDLFTLTTHLPHLLRILGLSTLTLYKHVLGRRRILIYTLPPVEASCILCQVAADMCYEDQVDCELMSGNNSSFGMDDGGSRIDGASLRPKGRCRESVRVLGMVTLNDLDRLNSADNCERGWIACTTDAIFLEKPSYYDLIIDLTTCTPFKASRPTLYLSKPVEAQANPRLHSHRLSSVRFTWSDVKLWRELDRLLHRDSEDTNCCEPSSKSSLIQPSPWQDVWALYEDVCIVCAGLWMGTWRSNSVTSYSTVDGNMSNWGQIRLEGDNDLSLGGSYVRNFGMGIEGRPPSEQNNQLSTTSLSQKTSKRGSGTPSWSKATAKGGGGSQVVSSYDVHQVNEELEDEYQPGTRERQVLTTLALLQTFHAHTVNILSQLSSYLPSPPLSSPDGGLAIVTLTPKDLVSFELGPLSNLDARFIEWLGDEYGSQAGVRVVVKRGWRDLVCFVFGFG